MTTYHITRKTDATLIAEYDADYPLPEHLADAYTVAEVSPAYVAPDAPDAPVDTRMFGGRRRLTKLEFVTLLGDDFVSILSAAKQSVDVEAFVLLVTLATPDPDGTAIDLDDHRMQALHQLEIAGVLGESRAEVILNG